MEAAPSSRENWVWQWRWENVLIVGYKRLLKAEPQKSQNLGFQLAEEQPKLSTFSGIVFAIFAATESHMKNILLFISLAIALSSCSLFKKTAQKPASPSANTTKPAARKTVAPMETAAVEEKTEPIPAPADEISNVPVLSPEMMYDLQFKYAILLDLPVEEMLDHQFIRFMENWYGTRYRMGGTDSTGIDCSAFVMQYMGYFHRINLPRTSRDQYKYARAIPVSELKEGDLVFFRTTRKKDVSHVGVYIRNNKFAHASTRQGVVISDLSEPYYHDHFVGAGRVKE